MAETMKTARIVSETDDDNLEEALMEEFNMRLKSCMSQDDLQQNTEDTPDHQQYDETGITKNLGVSSSRDFIKAEQESYYEVPVVRHSNGIEKQNGHHRPDEDESIYENVTHQTSKTDDDVTSADQYVDMGSPVESHEVESNEYEDVANRPDLTLTDLCDVINEKETEVKSVKDRMLLSTDVAPCLLFTQTVTSPMLTPSDENIDFLKGFQTESNGDLIVTDIDEEVPISPEENVYENSEFLKNSMEKENKTHESGKEETHEHVYENTKQEIQEQVTIEEKLVEVNSNSKEVIYENLKDIQESIYENLKPQVEGKVEDVYQNVEELREETKLTEESHNETEESRSETVVDEEFRNEETSQPEIIESKETALGKEIGEGCNELKSVDIIKQFSKFESENSTQVTESYVETTMTTIESNSLSDKGLKKKKTKKSRKEEKENISVDTNINNCEETFYNVNVKNLCRSFGDLTKIEDDRLATNRQLKNGTDRTRTKSLSDVSSNKLIENVFSGVSVRALKSSFNKFDALQKKNVLHVRSSDSSKAQEKFNGAQAETSTCKACDKTVFQMEQIKAERAIWHKNCFRCKECNKQLNVDTYQSHEGSLFCKPHFKALFAPKVVEDDAPPSDKPDLGLEELQSLNVRERFQVFEHHQTESSEVDRGLSTVNVKRSPSILSKLAKFQAKGMDIGVADDSLNGIPIEESSTDEEEVEEVEGEDADLVRAKKVQKEKPFHFTGMHDVKNKWEHGEQQQQTKDERREERKQEIQTIRNRLFMGKQVKMKEAYQQAVMESESCSNIRKEQPLEVCDTRSIKERFEKGEVVNTETAKERDNEDTEVFESEISKKSRSLFLELDANASKPPQITPIPTPKVDVKKAREASTPEREVYRDPDIVRSEEYVEDSVIAKETHTATKMLNKFRQMEENLGREPQPAGPKPLKRFTPPPEPTKPESNSEAESGSEEESEEEDQVDRAKIPDEDLLEAQKAARAKQLRAKFERWEVNEIEREQKNGGINIVEELGEDQSQIESTKSLRARFESMRETSTETNRQPRVKVNRFVDIPSVTETCESCNSRVYPLEKISVHNHVYHKKCFKCMECSCILRMDSYSYNQGLLYCMPHFKRLFISKGNYDTGFGLGQRKEKWNATMA